MITNLLHQDQADLQQYIEEKHLALYASNPSENTDERQHIVNTNYTQQVQTGTYLDQVKLGLLEA